MEMKTVLGGLMCLSPVIIAGIVLVSLCIKKNKSTDLDPAPEVVVPVASPPRTSISIVERTTILEQNISHFISHEGWRVQSRTDTTAQLVKDKNVGCLIAIVLFILGILPGILYLISCSGVSSLYLSVTQYGDVEITR